MVDRDTQQPLFDMPAEPHAPRVVHCKKAPAGSFVYIGRPSMYGNPFPLTDPKDPAVCAACISSYRHYFQQRTDSDQRFPAVLSLAGQVLGC